MPSVVSVVGKPDCGKTTLLERLIPELNRQGYRVGTIKHHVHQFEMDTPGKDTWRHKRAGARIVALSSPTGLGLVRDVEQDCSLEELVGRYFFDVDLVLTEGYKRAGMPKIEVYRRSIHTEPLPADETWIAMVSDFQLSNTLPHFTPDDIPGLASFLIERFISPASQSETALMVDGRPIPLNSFVQGFLRRAVTGMITSLKGCRHPREICLYLRNEPRKRAD